eukprot:TRINITY_DN17287_c0_g1_i1.p1 TRINITY_DN17287_c0_g1~~TRINITY_DN17287_c0_g1_i1.p1  ORF type:complete len:363 (+),score=119.89 TRINITY_DN17287_c0_g1_i1:87-1091(+)
MGDTPAGSFADGDQLNARSAAAFAEFVHELAHRKMDPNMKRNILRAYRRATVSEHSSHKLQQLEQDEGEAQQRAQLQAALAEAAAAAYVEPTAEEKAAATGYTTRDLSTGSPLLQALGRAFRARGAAAASDAKEHRAVAAAERRAAACRSRVAAARSFATLRAGEAEASRVPTIRREIWDAYNGAQRRRRSAEQRAAEAAAAAQQARLAEQKAAAAKRWAESLQVGSVFMQGRERQHRAHLGQLGGAQLAAVELAREEEAAVLQVAHRRQLDALRSESAVAVLRFVEDERCARAAEEAAEAVALTRLAASMRAPLPRHDRMAPSSGARSLPTTA